MLFDPVVLQFSPPRLSLLVGFASKIAGQRSRFPSTHPIRGQWHIALLPLVNTGTFIKGYHDGYQFGLTKEHWVKRDRR